MASLLEHLGRARWALPVALSLASGACGGDGEEAGSGGSGG
ncbi:MAG: iron ABC transporter substrate-binding protein, partial [Sorangiineae bacterium PRO1]|nr:iron ABC transporter substrate-binding protein [Sorangiineae bacterium PRO1]